jgi:hypothetical protein
MQILTNREFKRLVKYMNEHRKNCDILEIIVHLENKYNVITWKKELWKCWFPYSITGQWGFSSGIPVMALFFPTWKHQLFSFVGRRWGMVVNTGVWTEASTVLFRNFLPFLPLVIFQIWSCILLRTGLELLSSESLPPRYLGLLSWATVPGLKHQFFSLLI